MKDAENLNLDGRKLMIRYSNDKSHLEGNKDAPKSGNNKFSIFVGNLSFKSNENSIRKFFSSCGKILDIRIAKNEEGRMKGFAHIDFEDQDGVDNAVKKNGEELDGRPLKVDVSSNKPSGAGKGGDRGRGGRGGRGRGGRGQANPMDKAKKSGAIVTSGESKAVVFDSDDDE